MKVFLVSMLLLFVSSLATARVDKFRCMFRDDPATTMVIGWNQVSGAQPTIYYGEQDGGSDPGKYHYRQGPDRVSMYKGMNNHFARLRQLKPNTTYYFIIVDSEGASKRFWFRTLPNSSKEKLSIIAGGDSRNYREGRMNANKLVAKLFPHLVLFGGDMTGGDSDSEWQQWLDDWQLTISKDGRMTPVLTARGNHERSNLSIYNLFDTPSPDIYYALNLGGNLVRVYTLNSLIPVGGSQKAWLEKDLTEQGPKVRWRITQYHYAIRPHTQKKAEEDDQLRHWATLFYQHQMQLAVECDVHTVKYTWPIKPGKGKDSDEGFIRDDAQGTVYIGEGCWGAPLRANNDDKSWTRASGSFNQFHWIFISEDVISIRTVKTDEADKAGTLTAANRFTTPVGLSIWSPPTGAVVEIPWKQGKPIVASTKPSSPKMPIQLSTPVITTDDASGKLLVEWQCEGGQVADLRFQIMRQEPGKKFIEVGQVAANATGKYQYSDNPAMQAGTIHYQIIPSHKPAKPAKASFEIRNEWLWRTYPKMSPDPEFNHIKVRYALVQISDVDIVLMDHREKTKARVSSQAQKPGNYQRTLDTKKLDKGIYLLVIKSNDHVIDQYRVEISH